MKYYEKTSEMKGRLVINEIEKIGDKLDTEYENILLEEKKKLGLDIIPIIKIICHEKINMNVGSIQQLYEEVRKSGTAVKKSNEFGYIFRINIRDMETPEKFRKACKEELYHIAAGHCDYIFRNKNNSMTKNLLFDITACLYWHFGINLSKIESHFYGNGPVAQTELFF